MQKLLQRLKADFVRFKSAPSWRLALYSALVILAIAYALWLRFGPQPVAPGQVVASATSPKVASMEKEAVPVKLQVIKDKATAVKRLGLPAASAANQQEKLVDAPTAPASRYGTTTAVFVNVSTGQTRSEVKVNAAPWFRFERDNRAGAEVGMGLHGRYFRADYQRDILSIKGVVIGARASVTSYPSDTDAQIGIRAEYRW